MDYKKLQKSILEDLKKLDNDKHFLGAYIFGSAARGEFGKESDIDVKVLVDKSDCTHVSHPFIRGVKLDITFMSYDHIIAVMDKQVAKRERVPMIAESIIIFDKTGKLRELKKKYSKVKAPKYKPADYEGIIFLAYHFTNCIERYLQSDPAAAFAGMHTNLTNLIEMRYRTVGRWQVSSKRLLKDLRSWDKPFSVLIEKFLKEADLNKKFKLWLVVKDYVLKPLGGARPVADLNCDCKSCSIYLKKVGELEQILT